MKTKADITALRVDFDVDVYRSGRCDWVLATRRPSFGGALLFVSPAFTSKRDLLRYCESNFDDVLHFLHPEAGFGPACKNKSIHLKQV